ncbi:FG-GAP repeat domain-containing protein [Aquihabitans sp. McL0605]|uniref:FG-GAP repeat domain-containing protein n=1 Tax=Aquihabitans sp. McL0605 TaxID=3415671 RepID=UPI003CEB0E7A
MRAARSFAAAATICAGLLLPSVAHGAPLQFFAESAPTSASYDGTGATPLVGDFNGDGNDDLFLYRPGAATETVKWGQNSRTFSTSTAATYQVKGTYQPLVGDFDGNGVTDIFWYAPGPAADTLWAFHPGGSKTVVPKTVNGTFKPIVGDFVREAGDPDGALDIFWYAPGTAADSLWEATGGSHFHAIPQTVNGSFTPLVGGFTPKTGSAYGGSVDLSVDIFWYAPGKAADSLWNGHNDGTWTKIPKTVNGTYKPFVGLFDGYGVDDIFWYSSSGADSVWLGDPDTGAQDAFGASIGSGYTPVVGSFLIPDEPIYWYSPTGPDDFWLPQGAPGTWDYSTLANNTDMGPGYQPQTGDFDGDGHNDIYWLRQGTGSERMFWGPNPDA